MSAEFSYSVEIQPAANAASLSNVLGDSTVFEAHQAGAYAVQVDGAVTNVSGRVHAAPAFAYLSVAACSKPVLTNARFTANGLLATAFKGDGIDLAVDATPGNCGAASAALTFSWSLSSPAGSTAVLTPATSATPSFIADVAGGTFLARVTATDAQGNTSDAALVSIAVSSCGSSPITASIAVTSSAPPQRRPIRPPAVRRGSSSSRTSGASRPPRRLRASR